MSRLALDPAAPAGEHDKSFRPRTSHAGPTGRSRPGSAVRRGLGLLALGIALAPLPVRGQETAPPSEPPPRVRVSGIRTLTTRSRITYRAVPDRPHVMEAAFAFPDRGRWRLTEEIPDPPGVRARFQLGDRVHGVDPGGPRSRVIDDGAERATVLRELALRRALLLWPRTVDWEREGATAVADLGSVGRLVARFEGSDDLPLSIAGETAEGVETERFNRIVWTQPDDARFARPAHVTLEAGGQAIWDEEFLDFDPAANYVDSYFLPQDRRAPPRRIDSPDPGSVAREVRIAPIPAKVVRRFPLEGPLEWPARWAAALEVADEAERALGKLGRKLHPAMTFELDGEGRPGALLLRLAPLDEDDEPRDDPPGWEPVAGGDAASVFLPAISPDLPLWVSLLEETAEGAAKRGGTPYVVVRRAPEPGRAQLVLPFLD